MGHPRAGLDYAAGGRIVITRMSVSLIRARPVSSHRYQRKLLLGDRLSAPRSDPKITCLTGPQKSRLPITLGVPYKSSTQRLRERRPTAHASVLPLLAASRAGVRLYGHRPVNGGQVSAGCFLSRTVSIGIARHGAASEADRRLASSTGASRFASCASFGRTPRSVGRGQGAYPQRGFRRGHREISTTPPGETEIPRCLCRSDTRLLEEERCGASLRHRDQGLAAHGFLAGPRGPG